MQFIKKSIIALTLLISLITFAQSETTWITKKKDKSKKVEKVEKKETVSSWIKKKKKEIKDNKKEYKKEEKKITNEVKSWIKKKSKDKYLASIDDLPKEAIYFTGVNENGDLLIYGYVTPDTSSKLINGYYETSMGYGYFDDGETTCKIGSTVLIVIDGEVTARVSGICSNGIKFSGKTTQDKNSGWGSAKSSDGLNRFNFDFNNNKSKIAKLFEENSSRTLTVNRKLPKKKK